MMSQLSLSKKPASVPDAQQKPPTPAAPLRQHFQQAGGRAK